MPCGKRPLVKSWDRPRKIKVVAPSKYEKNLDTVKVHWKKVIRDLELSYKDDQFWESQCDTVRELVGPIIFVRIAKIFNLPFEATKYHPHSGSTTPEPSEQFYQTRDAQESRSRDQYSMSDFTPSVLEEEQEESKSEQWSVSSEVTSVGQRKSSRIKSVSRMKSLNLSQKLSSRPFTTSFSKFFSKTMVKSYSSRIKIKSDETSSIGSPAHTLDDLDVYHSFTGRPRFINRRVKNPHFHMLYCNESETDMIKWKSKYKQKFFEVSASDEFSKKAEIMTKKIAKEFYDWWLGLGNVEFKSEIKRPEDIEDLFQVWFDEHASRGLVLHPKILPCVLQSIANYVGVPKASCPNVLKRQIAYDIHAETSPAHTKAFGTCLPQKIRHIPPKNNTESLWHCVKIPEDLRSMACVWDDIQHLTSTKAFQKWLDQKPHLPMPSCLKQTEAAGDKKQLFIVPSDYVVKAGSLSASQQDLALPVSQFSLELKEVLSKLMNQ